MAANLARRMTPTAINQLWVADITYIRLLNEFIYLGRIEVVKVLLDAGVKVNAVS